MNGVSVNADQRSAIISGGARAADVAAVTDPLHVAAVTGTCSGVGMAGLTLGGGYGPLIGRCGLALDNLLAVEVVLADGRVVVADDSNEAELFSALRGGGGNFGVVTAMRHRLHDLPSVHSGMLVYPFAEAKAVMERCADIAASSPEDLTVQFACVASPDGKPVDMVLPTWCGLPAEGETRVAPFLKLGTLLAGNLAGCGKSRDFEKMAMERARYRNEGHIRSMAYGRAPGDEWQRNDDQSTFSASCLKLCPMEPR